jgi:hypothetical protein
MRRVTYSSAAKSEPKFKLATETNDCSTNSGFVLYKDTLKTLVPLTGLTCMNKLHNKQYETKTKQRVKKEINLQLDQKLHPNSSQQQKTPEALH